MKHTMDSGAFLPCPDTPLRSKQKAKSGAARKRGEGTQIHPHGLRRKPKMPKIINFPKKTNFKYFLSDVNLEKLNKNDFVISSGTCDGNAVLPILKILLKCFDIESGNITTLHPWLSYQNLLDGASRSDSNPGEIFHHYALGRSALGNLIPKPTSALDAVIKVIPNLNKKSFTAMSFRTPTEIVGSADITFITSRETSKEKILTLLEDFQKNLSLAQ